jgi:hypothetical protein
MDIGYTLLLAATLFVMFLGLAASFLPAVPGLPIVYAAALLFGIITGFEEIGAGFLVPFGILTVLILILDYLAGVYGARRMGATRWGVLGALIGALLGLVVGGPVGLILGPLVGAVGFELIMGTKFRAAFQAGVGTFLGYIAGIIMKSTLSLVMILIFLWKVIL